MNDKSITWGFWKIPNSVVICKQVKYLILKRIFNIEVYSKTILFYLSKLEFCLKNKLQSNFAIEGPTQISLIFEVFKVFMQFVIFIVFSWRTRAKNPWWYMQIRWNQSLMYDALKTKTGRRSVNFAPLVFRFPRFYKYSLL